MRLQILTLKKLFVFFFLYILVGGAAISKAYSDTFSNSKNVWDCFSTDITTLKPADRYSRILNCTREFPPSSFSTFDERHSFNQALATVFSFVGRDTDAIEIFDRELDVASDANVQNDFDQLRVEPALNFIVNRANRERVVMVNEAHHVPQTRALTIGLLKPLFELGYRYFAAESFTPAGVAEANQKGYPTQKMGFYNGEPVFGELVREAKRIGFVLVAYEHEGSCDYHKDPEGCQDQREKGQAQNLMDRILESDPTAKILIHAGYGHISEIGGSETFPWKPMARYFSELSGINPLTIDQVTFYERGKQILENPLYRPLVKKFAVKAPVAITNFRKDAWIYPTLAGQYDIQVVLPPTELRSNRPTWRNTILSQRPLKIALPKQCRNTKCLVQAVRIEEASDHYVPSDQILAERATSAQIFLSTGKFQIEVFDIRGTLLKSVQLTVN